MERLKIFLDRWGYYLLAMLCIAVILLSAMWTNQQRSLERPQAQALADESQRLEEAKQAPKDFHWPVSNEILRPFSQIPLYFEAVLLWQAHPAIDFSAQEGDPVFAMEDGRAAVEEDALCLVHADGRISRYRGLASLLVKEGQQIRRGEMLGLAGGRVAFEGNGGHICVQVLDGGKAVDFASELAKNGGIEGGGTVIK